MEIKTLENNLFSFLKGGGEMAHLISRYTWNETSLGVPATWSAYLKSALSILIHVRFPMLLLWGNDHICFYNNAFKDAFQSDGKHPGALGKRAAEVWPDESNRIEPLIRRAFAGESLPLQTHESFPLFLNNKSTWKYSISQVYNDLGEVGGVVVTGQGTATEQLQALNEELAATNEELSQANGDLINANNELEQYAYVASHDLQEPLRKIQTFASLLNDSYSSELSQDAATYLSKITASSVRMSMLIKDFLDYSRLTHRRPLYQPTDLNVIVNNVLSDYEFVIKQRNATFEVEVLPTIEAIPIQMNQLFYNLIGNSLKFSRKGVQSNVKIMTRELSAEKKREYRLPKLSKKYFEITVSDNGIGFSQEYAEQIFTIFQRLNDKSVYGGYGIGLALCRRIVTNHDGVIVAQGGENNGACFKFVLPEKHK